MAYAATTDLPQELLGRTSNAEQLLGRASRDVDQALLCSAFDPADVDTAAILKAATIEQAAGYIEAGDPNASGNPAPQSFSLGGLSVQRGSTATPAKPGGLHRQAWLILQQAGLTGHAPRAV